MKDTSGVCPWQAGAMLTTPLRKLFHNPQRILQTHLSAGMSAMDVGCGMGYFTIPMSRITGVNGQVIAVDLQPQMLDGLLKNAGFAVADNPKIAISRAVVLRKA